SAMADWTLPGQVTVLAVQDERRAHPPAQLLDRLGEVGCRRGEARKRSGSATARDQGRLADRARHIPAAANRQRRLLVRTALRGAGDSRAQREQEGVGAYVKRYDVMNDPRADGH